MLLRAQQLDKFFICENILQAIERCLREIPDHKFQVHE
jgi:hypothetical protein